MEARVVADESVDFRLVSLLRAAGAEVYSILEQHPSTDDPNTLQIAADRDSLLLTEDKDFGDLVFRTRLPTRVSFCCAFPISPRKTFP